MYVCLYVCIYILYILHIIHYILYITLYYVSTVCTLVYFNGVQFGHLFGTQVWSECVIANQWWQLLFCRGQDFSFILFPAITPWKEDQQFVVVWWLYSNGWRITTFWNVPMVASANSKKILPQIFHGFNMSFETTFLTFWPKKATFMWKNLVTDLCRH